MPYGILLVYFLYYGHGDGSLGEGPCRSARRVGDGAYPAFVALAAGGEPPPFMGNLFSAQIRGQDRGGGSQAHAR
jgi:hypothetical protein